MKWVRYRLWRLSQRLHRHVEDDEGDVTEITAW